MYKIFRKLRLLIPASIAIMLADIAKEKITGSRLFSSVPEWVWWIIVIAAILVEVYLKFSQTSASAESGIKNDQPFDFIGRKDKVAEFKKFLIKPTKQRALVIHGMGGIGKTTLAEYVIDEVKNSFDEVITFPFGKQIFDPATGMMKKVENETSNTDALFTKIVNRFGIPGITEKSTNLNEKKLILREKLREKRIIILFDNIESEPEINSQVIDDTCSILSSTSRLLVTSRIVIKGEQIRHSQLTGLSERDTITLLKKHGDHVPAIRNSSSIELIKIHRAVNGCPLAAKLIIGQLIDHDLSSILRNLAEVNLDENHEQFYTFLFKQSWDSLSEKAKFLIADIATYYGPMTRLSPEEIISSNYVEKVDFSSAMSDLVRRSLIEKHENASVDKATYELHPLTHNFVRAQLDL